MYFTFIYDKRDVVFRHRLLFVALHNNEIYILYTHHKYYVRCRRRSYFRSSKEVAAETRHAVPTKRLTTRQLHTEAAVALRANCCDIILYCEYHDVFESSRNNT